MPLVDIVIDARLCDLYAASVSEKGEYMRKLEQYPASQKDQRIVKLLLPLPLIRAMDRLLIEGVGGFTTRNEFVHEAIESYMFELTHESAPDEPVQIRRRGRLRSVSDAVPVAREAAAVGDVPAGAPTAAIELATTALPAMASDGPVIAGEAQPVSEPLFGLHNRDYPSLWAAARLAAYVETGPLAFEEFAERATNEAWEYAAGLRHLESELGAKLTALFPTNWEKREAATGAFRMFAIGSVTVAGTAVRATGPLFLWHVIDVEWRGGEIAVGLRAEGRELLSRLAGMTVEPPHPHEHAHIFLEHLRHHAPADYWGFELVLATVAERPSRSELIGAFQRARPDWRESVAATNAQGYVARGREWGLIAPKVAEGRYELTKYGAELIRGGVDE